MNFQISGDLVLRLIKKYLVLTFLIGVVGGLVTTYIGVQRSKSTYVSSGELVQNDNNYNLIDSYKQFVSSKRFTGLLDNKIKRSEWKSKQYSYSVEVESTGSRSTPFFTLQVTSTNKDFSKFVANQAISLFNTSIGKYLSGANITIVSRASNPIVHGLKSKTINWFVYGSALTFVIVGTLLTLRYLFLGKIRDEHFISDVFKCPCLGSINIEQSEK